MWPLPSWLPYAGAALLCASGWIYGGIEHVKLSEEREGRAQDALEWARADRKAFDQAMADRDAAIDRGNKASADFEAWKATQRPKVITITKEVRNASQTDAVCSARPLPAGLRDALKRAPEAVGARDASEPGGVPSVGRR